eukprot:11170275-Lingulodinium_polyedra.AAC.1
MQGCRLVAAATVRPRAIARLQHRSLEFSAKAELPSAGLRAEQLPLTAAVQAAVACGREDEREAEES